MVPMSLPLASGYRLIGEAKLTMLYNSGNKVSLL